ncbi:MAG TPA: YceI family protein [Hyphomicrobiales bacterium]|nr:YceI family protein [Hyphomicrobiales bacterium]
MRYAIYPGAALLLGASSLLLGSLSARAAEAGGDYASTRQYGSVLFRVMQQEYLHLVGRFDNYSGTLHLDTADLANSTLSASVDMTSLSLADKDVVETLVNSSVWFNASLYAEATFTSTTTEVVGEDEVIFHGELSFVGKTLPWDLHVTFYPGASGELGGSSVGILGKGTINRLDFGLDQYRNMAADTVEVEVNVKFNKN